MYVVLWAFDKIVSFDYVFMMLIPYVLVFMEINLSSTYLVLSVDIV
jgi:hypothetical protein